MGRKIIQLKSPNPNGLDVDGIDHRMDLKLLSYMTLDLLSTFSTGEILEGYFKNVNPQDVPLLLIPQIEPLAQNIKEVFSPRHQLQNGKRVIRS